MTKPPPPGPFDPDEDLWLTTTHVQAILHCSRGYLYKLARAGKLRTRKHGWQRRFYRGDVQSWLRRQQTRAKRHPQVMNQATAQREPIPPPVWVDPGDLRDLRAEVRRLAGLLEALLARPLLPPAA